MGINWSALINETTPQEQQLNSTMNDKLINSNTIPSVPILKHVLSKNKYGLQGDFLDNYFQRNLIAVNINMHMDYTWGILIVDHWFRTNIQTIEEIEVKCNSIFPENMNVIIAEFYVLPQCSNCKNPRFDNLWLNLNDGFIGCGRRVNTMPDLGGNGCSLLHYQKYKASNVNFNCNESQLPMVGSQVVKLGTITSRGADVYDYELEDMVMIAMDDDNSDIHVNDYWINSRTQQLSVEDLQRKLKYWGIQMGSMYMYDLTTMKIEHEANDFWNNWHLLLFSQEQKRTTLPNI